MTPSLSVDVDHRQGAFHLRAAFEAPAGVTVLFGRSGSGKSTLVNVIAGLVRPARGRVVVDGRVLLDTDAGLVVPRHRRGIGYVFQDARLFPHLSVRQNLLFGRYFSPRRDEGARFEDVVALLGLSDLLGRRPAALSGGEKQRVAIGRALLSKPRLLLMDEPLAALDEGRKAEILPYIERLRDEAGVPIVYVSHAMAEVARLAETLVVLEGGRVTASGPAAALLSSSAASLSAIRETGAVVEATLIAQDEVFGLTRLGTPLGDLQLARIEAPLGTRLRLQILARDVMVSLARPEGLSALNILSGTIAELPPSGERQSGVADVVIACGGGRLVARLTRKSLHDLGLTPGLRVYAIVKSVALDH